MRRKERVRKEKELERDRKEKERKEKEHDDRREQEKRKSDQYHSRRQKDNDDYRRDEGSDRDWDCNCYRLLRDVRLIATVT